MSKIIVLTFNHENENNLILNKMNQYPYTNVYPVLRDLNFIGKCLRRLNFKFFPYYVDYWFSNSWKNKIEPSDTVVCIANFWSPIILKRISKKYKCRCINYFWDKVVVSHYPIEYSNSFENWTFDLEDSKSFNMLYNPQFYIDNLIDNDVYQIKFDISFIGADRNGNFSKRVLMANDYYIKCSDLNLKTFFYLVSSSSNADQRIVHNSPLKIEEVLEIMMESKAILEIVDPGKAQWLTLRPFQALSNNRKLITNNLDIINYDFYNPNDIFVIGLDNWSRLPIFLNTPFVPIGCLEQYSFINWLKRFVAK